jgi:hypothetical protein
MATTRIRGGPRAQAWHYFVNIDGAFFRKRAASGLCCVDDVWTPTGWVPFTGDRGAPYAFGNRIDEGDLPIGALPGDLNGGCGGCPK